VRRVIGIVGVVVALAALPTAPGQAKEGSRFHPATVGTLGVVATESPAASRVGRAVLESGGNAIDAAAATVFALNVARPQSCGIGGGGFMVYRSASGKARALDFRETAPASIRSDQFVDDPLARKFTGHTTVGVPGVVAGMDAALARYGTLSLRQAIAPAEELARRGFRVPTSLTGSMRANAERLQLFPAAAAQFLKNATAYDPGDTLVQPELAATLRRLMRGGRDAFYKGTIARRIVADMNAPRGTNDPGLMTMADLAAYRAKWRRPIVTRYRGREIIGMPPPTSGGIAIAEMLNILDGFDLRTIGMSTADTIHLVADAQRIAWADRNAYVADPDFVNVPTTQLTSREYAAQRRGEIALGPTHSFAPGTVSTASPARSSRAEENPLGSTTQVSIVDARGAAVSLTCTIEQEFGSAVVAPGTGFLLNNELTDFGDPGTANQAAPGKRPRSSMSPEVVVSGRQPRLVTGGAGGATIIMGVLHTILDTIDFRQDLAQAVDAERYDDQGSATLMIEDGRLAPGVTDDLKGRGYSIASLGEYGVRPRVQLAGIDAATGRKVAVSDSRSDHAALAQRPERMCHGGSATIRCARR
jgi:gamma-glutamyltranspeptidase/glutathione hydrolase